MTNRVITDVVGSYGQSWGEAAETVASMDWYHTRTLATAVNFAGKINFSIVTERENALQMLKDIPSNSPVDFDRRFPERGTYICAGKGDWPRKFTQVFEALSYKETSSNPSQIYKAPNNSNTVQATAKSSDSVGFGDWDKNMAERAFFTGIEAIKSQMGRNERIFGRGSFEAEYGLEWQ